MDERRKYLGIVKCTKHAYVSQKTNSLHTLDGGMNQI